MSNNSAVFDVGDSVVYPAHGVGKITCQESQSIGGSEINVFVINFSKDKMTLRIPVKRASATGLRQLSTQEDLAKVLLILQGKAKTSKGMWSRRAQEYEGKINSGDIMSLAEVVRDLFKNIEDPERSYSERVIYESAFNRLITEVSAIENIEITEASAKLLEILKEKCFV
jgi:CarD family transcriptional regulator